MFCRHTNALQVASKRTKMEEVVRKQNILVSKFRLPTTAVKKKNNKDRFLSISLRLSIIDKNFNLSIVINFLKIHQFFRRKKQHFWRKWGKTFWRT